MAFLVVQERGRYPLIRIVKDEDELIDGRFESWVLNNGKRFLAVDRKLPNSINHLHISGTFETGAMYHTNFDELVMIVTEIMGEHDRDRYHRLQLEGERSKVPLTNYQSGQIMLDVLTFIGRVFWASLKCLATLLAWPFILKWINGGRGKSNH